MMGPPPSGGAARGRRIGHRCAQLLATCGVYVLGLALLWTGICIHLSQERRTVLRHRLEEAGNLTRGFEENIASDFTTVDQELLFMRVAANWQHTAFNLAQWARSSAFLNSQTMQMSLVDRNGLVLQSNLGRPKTPVSIADREHFRVQRDDPADRIFISRLVLGRVSHKLSLNVTRKVLDQSGAFAGVVVVSFSPEYLNTFYGSLRIGHGRLTIAGSDGVIRARSPDMPQIDSPVLLDPTLLRMAQSGAPSLAHLDEPTGRIVALRHVPGFPLTVAVELPLSETLAGYRDDRAGYVLVGSAVSLAMTLIWLLLLAQTRRTARSRETLALALGSISQGLLMVDSRRQVAVMNPRAADLLGLPRELAHENTDFNAICAWQETHREFGDGNDPAQELQLRAMCFSLEAGVYERERANGTALEIRTHVLPDGSAVRTLTDVTEQRRHEQALRDARDAAEAGSLARTEFLAVMSHEIRTPLNGIIGLATLLADSPIAFEERQHVRLIRSSGEHLLTLVNEILDFAKIDTVGIELEDIAFSLRDVMDQVVGMLRPQADEKKLALKSRVDRDLPDWLRGDPARIRQILLNLGGNAIKFTEAGEVVLAVTADAAQGAACKLRFEVRDTGIGIPSDMRSRLFRPFTQVDQSVSRRFGGTGLGLVISKRLVTRMGGTIDVESSPGQGSLFWFELPLSPATATAPEDTRSEPAVMGRRILLAEDNAINRLVAERLLGRHGHIVETANDGREAFGKLQAGGYDVLITDVMMPVMDGLELTRRVRDLPPPLNAIPIIGLTAKSGDENRRECLDAGMDEVLCKPISPDLLERLVRRVGLPRCDDIAPQAAPANYNPAQLDTLRDAIGENGVAEVIALFRRQIGQQLEKLRMLEKAGDRMALLREVHALASSARSIGLEGLGSAAREIENGLQDAGTRVTDPQITRLSALTAEALAWLERIVPSPSTAAEPNHDAGCEGRVAAA